MKKIIFCLAGLLLLAIAANPAPVAAAYIPMAADLIKTAKFPAVYVVDDNLKRHLFSNEATFWTWYVGGWSAQNIKVISQDDFDQLDTGKNITARPGANLIQFDNGNKAFAVTPGGVLCEVRSLYGADWQDRIIKIQAAFETDYVKDNSCILTSGGKLPNGSLIQYLNSKDVWYITSSGAKKKISAAGLTANNFQDASIVKSVPAYMTYASAAGSITGYDPSLSILANLEFTQGDAIKNRPDLIITDIVFPTARIITNQTVEITLVIKNIGGNLSSDAGLRNILFTGADWTTAGISHANYPTTISPLQIGQTFEVTYSGRFVASGDKNFTAKADEPSELVELSETNNSYSEKITVYAQ